MAPMTSAERQRKYREKLKREDPEKIEKLKKENAERTKKKYKKINELPDNLQKKKRKEWRQQKQKQKCEPKVQNIEEKKKRKARYLLSTENSALKQKIQKMSKVIKKQRKAIYRFKNKIENLKQSLNTLEKQLQEPRNLKENINIINEEPITPLSKTQKFIEETVPSIPSPEKAKVKKVIFEGLVLKESLSDQYSKAESKSEKDVLKKLINNDVVNKYKLKTKFSSSCLKLNGRLRQRQRVFNNKMRRIEEIRSFLERDDNSRITAGKRETKTQNKDKRQIRYLLNSLEKLHKIYKNEGGSASYTTFTRYRPYYILDPKITQRNTCACVKHANIKFLAQKLKVLGVIDTDDLDELVSMIVCDKLNDKCMYNECKSCQNKMVSFDLTQKNKDLITSWNAWVTKTHEYTKNNNNQDSEKKTTKRTTKDIIRGTLDTLIKSFSEKLLIFKKHYFNIHHAYLSYKHCKETLIETECIVHCDFSENYVCKSTEEVQATHFGASKQQFTLHTGVIYYKNELGLQEKSFCTISPNNNHGPIAIWAHLKPILENIKKTFGHVTTVHFFSDGPTTQYRQKGNFYLLSDIMKKLAFHTSTWSFFESAHGKGAADGIGGAVKRTLDRKVIYGEDIVDAKTAYNTLEKCQSKIMYFYISDENIKTLEQETNLTGLIPVPHTMEIHQIVITDQVDIIKFRKLACFCKKPSCECFDLQEHNLKMKIQKRKNVGSQISKKPIKKRRTEKPQKRSVRAESDTTSIDSDVTYAESDDSVWKPNEENDSDHEYGNDENIGIESLRSNYRENPEINNKKISLLSDIRNIPENRRYFDLNKYGPLTLHKVDKIRPRGRNNHDHASTVSYHSYHEPKKCSVNIEVAGVEQETVMEEQKIMKEEREDLAHFIGQESQGGRKIIKENIDCAKEANKSERKGNVHEEKKISTESEQKDFMNETNTEYTDEKEIIVDNLQQNSKREQKIEIEHISYDINDTVLVRYYEKKKWIYYIGFVTNIVMKSNDPYYTIRFLKTMTKPRLIFKALKKVDEDTVPADCVVKIIDLNNINNDYYTLKDNYDECYFN